MPPGLITACYPGFPTDLQSAFLAAMTLADGEGVLEETIFENRFRIVPQLRQMGARIDCQKNKVCVSGVRTLCGTTLRAEELRGGAALVIAGCAAQGRSVVKNRHFIERGYEDICHDLCSLGARCKKE